MLWFLRLTEALTTDRNQTDSTQGELETEGLFLGPFLAVERRHSKIWHLVPIDLSSCL